MFAEAYLLENKIVYRERKHAFPKDTNQTKPVLILYCKYCIPIEAPDKVRIFISKMSISWPNPMFDHLLESSHRDDSNKWSNIGFGQEIKELVSIEIHFTHLIWRSQYALKFVFGKINDW